MSHLVNARLTTLAFATIAVLASCASMRAHAQTVQQMPPGTQVMQMPDGTYVLIVPDGTTTLPPSYEQPPPPSAPMVPAPAATASAYGAQAYQPYGLYDRPGGFQPAAPDRLARVDARLRRERRSLIVGTVGFGAAGLGLMLAISDSLGSYDHYSSGYSDSLSSGGRAGIALLVLGAGSGIGGTLSGSIGGVRTSRELQSMGAPSGRGLAIASLVSASVVEPLIALPLGWAHYGVARRNYAALTGQRYRAGLELSLRPILDPTTGMRGMAVGGSF